MLVTHRVVCRMAPTEVLLMVVILLAMVLLMSLVLLIFMGDVHLHVPLMATPIHHGMLPLLMALVEHAERIV